MKADLNEYVEDEKGSVSMKMNWSVEENSLRIDIDGKEVFEGCISGENTGVNERQRESRAEKFSFFSL
ncbi:MAG: hypothetical protein ABEJ56_00870 [Candidatus Nanohaloarchaea archaeon]